MRRGMEHGARAVLREHLGHAGLVAHAADLDDYLDVVVLGQQLVAQHVGVVLVDVEDDDARGRHAAQLPAELAADGAAAARDQHALAGDVAGHGAGVQDDLLAAQEVGHVHVAQPHVAYLVERELAYVGQRAQLAFGLRALAVDALALLERGRGNGHDDLLDVVAVHQLHDVVRGAGHLHAVDTAAALRGVVVSGHDGHAGHERVLRGHAADGERARLPRAHDERARPVAGALRRPQNALLLAHDAEYQAYAPHEEYKQEARDEEHADGQAHVDDPQEHGADERGEHHREHDLDGLVDARVLPQVVVEAEQAEHRHVDKRQDAQHEVDLVVDEDLVLDGGEQGCEPVGGVCRNDVEQQQDRCSFCDMSVQAQPRPRVEKRIDAILPTSAATKRVLYTK